MLALVLVIEFRYASPACRLTSSMCGRCRMQRSISPSAPVIALPLALLIIAGEIDISVAAIIALASVAMGLAAAAGIQTPGLVALDWARDWQRAWSTGRS